MKTMWRLSTRKQYEQCNLFSGAQMATCVYYVQLERSRFWCIPLIIDKVCLVKIEHDSRTREMMKNDSEKRIIRWMLVAFLQKKSLKTSLRKLCYLDLLSDIRRMRLERSKHKQKSIYAERRSEKSMISWQQIVKASSINAP